MHIKICGITNTKDALHAVQAGASHLGMIFVETSPRCVASAEAQKIVAAVNKKAIVVGVFQNHSLEHIAETAVTTGIDAIQLHGEEDVAFCRSIALRLCKPVIKTIILGAQSNLEDEIASYGGENNIAYLLFDRAKGQTSKDWLADALTQISSLENQKDSALPPYFFAGGLTTDDIETVVSAINPSGVDVASGVEASPGKKDPALVDAFITKAKMPKMVRSEK
jgi:phosphoribosylanthranilate isomerase